MMEIIFTKHANNSNHISCKREDGSTTWMKCTDFFIRHDLMHFALETTFNFKNAFYGMIAGGISISDFNLPKEERTFIISDEADFG